MRVAESQSSRVLVPKEFRFLELTRMAKANPSAQGIAASEEMELLPEKQEAPKDLETGEETAKFNLWGFFLLHLSR